MIKKILENHVFASLTFIFVSLMGALAYLDAPREKYPSFRINTVAVNSALPGASAHDVEKLLTTPVEDAVSKVADVKKVTSTSTEGFSTVIVRFGDISTQEYLSRVTDLSREVTAIANAEFPKEASTPKVNEVNSSNAIPAATIVISAIANDENLRRQSRFALKDIERMNGIDRVSAVGLNAPELLIKFHPEQLQGLGLSPVDLSNTISAHFRDTSAGKLKVNDKRWVVRLVGTESSPEYLASLPILTSIGEVPLGSVADIQRAREKSTKLVHYDGRPAVLLNVAKKSSANTLEILDNVRQYLAERNALSHATGVKINLLYDQTESIRSSIDVMESNAVFGLLLVMAMTWLFLGWQMSLLCTFGIPFTLAGTFWALDYIGISLNNSVLLGVVISLGMLVDDVIVVVETIHYNLKKGLNSLQAVYATAHEVFAPVTAAVLTTIAAFMPLMQLPGIIGNFLYVVPLVVTLALIFSLIEAFWMLPSHVQGMHIDHKNPSRPEIMRRKYTLKIQLLFSKILMKVFRKQKFTVFFVISLFFLSIFIKSAGWVRTDYFALETYRVFYVELEMESGTPLDGTLDKLLELEELTEKNLLPGELQAKAVAVGQTSKKSGEQYGQIIINLNPQQKGMRDVMEVIESLRPIAEQIKGVASVGFLSFSDAPTDAPVKVKILGEDYDEIREAATALKGILEGMKGHEEISDETYTGSIELAFRVNLDAARRARLNPETIARNIRLLVDGEIVARVQDRGEKVNIRVLSSVGQVENIDQFLRMSIPLDSGGNIPLGELLTYNTKEGTGNLTHYKFKRALTVKAEIDKTVINVVQANDYVKAEWAKIQHDYPNIKLDFTGLLDDIEESLDAFAFLGLAGMLLIYLILGTQFNSFGQPFLILLTVPLAYIGVIFGLWITGNPMSLFTIYGIIALAGIAVNDSIVLISAINDRRRKGMSKLSATVYATRRRFVPILITSLTTIAGLFSLAAGFGGYSLMWSPVATVIVFGLTFSTMLVLFFLPLVYYIFAREDFDFQSSMQTRLFDRFCGVFGNPIRELRNQLLGADVSEFEDDYHHEEVISRGIQLFRAGKFWEAIIHFEKAALEFPNSKSLNVNAAQAMIIFMQKNGADIGFLKRAKRYLDRAAVVAPSDEKIRKLQKEYDYLVEVGGDNPNLD
jgi:multidrug efflux pump subunit AcrB